MIQKIFTTLVIFYLIIPQISICQDANVLIDQVDLRLKKGETSITKVLSSDSFMHLHSLTRFREVIKANARAGKISIVTDNEPGTRITVKATVLNENNIPQKNALVYLYQTSDKGWYSDTAAHILVVGGDMKYARYLDI